MTVRTALPLLDLAVAGGERAWQFAQWIGGRFRQGKNSCQAAPLDAKPQVMVDDPRSDVWRVHGVSIPMGPRMTGNIRRHMDRGSYELAEVRALWQIARAGDRVLELGTGCGLLATYAAKVCGSASVLTVEADPLLEPTIRAVFAANDVTPELVIAAVSADGAARHVLRAADFWATRTAEFDGSQAPGVPRVAGVAFESLLARHLPTIVVIDIEGGEFELCGVPLPSSVHAVIVETHGQECARAVRVWLQDQRFELDAEWVFTSPSPDVAVWRRQL